SRRTPRIERGESGELAVDLEPGTYTLWCSVGNHRELGMSTEIISPAGAPPLAAHNLLGGGGSGPSDQCGSWSASR
ncbi:hypothetical protein, partial [Nocardia cyriacigeorgica]|uniref:hypothetical protein n=1 Tax=Nocardia cyriacigeorgica TaxID=135487 RepID=UPI002455E19A